MKASERPVFRTTALSSSACPPSTSASSVLWCKNILAHLALILRPGDYGIFIALGFVPFMASIAAQNSRPERRAAGYAGLAFLVMYAVIIALVYYAQLTSVRMDGALGEETLSIINYGRAGSLFFNYDLLGYGFMALCTFFFAFTVEPKDNGDKVFRGLLWGHGAFFLPCLVMLMFRCLPPI